MFLEIVSSKTATTPIFQSGVRNWPASLSWHEIEVFKPRACELAGIQDPPNITSILFMHIQFMCECTKNLCDGGKFHLYINTQTHLNLQH